MLAVTAILAAAGITNANPRVADATDLPFADGSFDVLYNAYMLDLIPTDRIPAVPAEFRRSERRGPPPHASVPAQPHGRDGRRRDDAGTVDIGRPRGNISSMPDTTMRGLLEQNPQVQDFLKAVAGETRQRILQLFTDGKERTVGQVAAECDLGQSTASENLTMLRRGGLVSARREGKEVYYLPDRALIAARLHTLGQLLGSCCGTPHPDTSTPADQ